ncbi:hypothetical protein BT93_D1048 [Corymbia citriodora subsp. variegata]|nr:hypothetical protein BT93_D1048 [Corymbia citriodora subsp. variegata]
MRGNHSRCSSVAFSTQIQVEQVTRERDGALTRVDLLTLQNTPKVLMAPLDLHWQGKYLVFRILALLSGLYRNFHSCHSLIVYRFSSVLVGIYGDFPLCSSLNV